ncbi:MAG: VWA domain-containing protein, partial [Comamonadaceae bacterium]
GDAIASGVMLQRATGGPGGPGSAADGTAENFFLAMVEPPRSVPAGTILPRDYLFVVDISGSMHGFPLDTAKTMMSRLLGGLRPSDTFNVMLFSGSSRMLSPHSVPVTRSNIDQAVAALAQQAGGGGTELIPALRKAYAQPKPADVSRTVVVVTDGYVTIEKEAFELVRRNLGKANLFAFGIGSSVNRSLIEGLARAGRGEPFVITDPVQAEEQAARFRRMVESPVLTGVTARFEGLDVYDLEPAVLPDVLGERPVLIYGKWRGEARGRLVVEGRAADGAFRQEIAVEASAAIPGTALSALWARERIAALGDQESIEGDDSQAAAITALGLRHALLTKYTSFLAVDRLLRNPAPAESRSVDQPLPLPQGVSEQALGGAIQAQVPGTPEPEMLGAVAVMLSMLAMLRRRARRRNPAHYTS